VGDSQRYGVLHAAAEDLLDELAELYAVERREVTEPPTRAVRLIPRTPEAAPLSVVFTDAPSIILCLGRFYHQELPGCGCDACDENPADLIAELRVEAVALVEGGLWERVRRGLRCSWSQTRLIGLDVNARHQTPLAAGAARAARHAGFAAAVQWAPWPRRA
jgi:hypothetical protein